MPILMITNGLYSNAQEIIDNLGKKIGCPVITDKDIIEQTTKRTGIKQTTLQKVIESKHLAFNDFTHEREKCIACIKQTISEYLQIGNCLFHGIIGHSIPKHISHVMRVLIITDKETRIKNGMALHGISKKEVVKAITRFDKHAFLWSNAIVGKKAWEKSLYDIVIPTDKMNKDASLNLISEHIQKILTLPDELIKKEVADFLLMARIEVALAGMGNKLDALADSGHITITINKSVMMLSRFKQKIITLVQGIEGVKSVETKLGKNFYSNTIVRRMDMEATPLRLLLVDDEKEFVQTLSERLKLRKFPSEIAYNGQQALNITDQEDTEVMILDLKMPGIDGFEVLKKIKKTKPNIEVIILTGHGSEKDKKTCMELGAFAYLQKPADIDLITSTMRKAYEKIKAKKFKQPIE
jgi:two-component system response regulator CpxR